MRKKVLASKVEELEVGELEAEADHNELWQKGDRLTKVVVGVVESLT
jgi:hypothetical protein